MLEKKRISRREGFREEEDFEKRRISRKKGFIGLEACTCSSSVKIVTSASEEAPRSFSCLASSRTYQENDLYRKSERERAETNRKDKALRKEMPKIVG